MYTILKITGDFRVRNPPRSQKSLKSDRDMCTKKKIYIYNNPVDCDCEKIIDWFGVFNIVIIIIIIPSSTP